MTEAHVPSSLRAGRYSLVETLGAGGMASVHRAWDHRLQVWRAIKLLHPAYASRRALRERFEGEARAMAALEHPNVARVLDVDQEGETLFLVMEVLDGGSPADWLERHGPMPPRLALDVVLQMCAGVSAAHARGIVHRDLKPQNLLIASDGVVKVSDFGIARMREGDAPDLTRTGSVMGTLGFMAPEQRNDAKSVDVRADVYAIGATLFALCTDRVAIELFAAMQAPQVLQGLPPRLAPVVVKACRMEPDHRYATVEALAVDLRKLSATFPALGAEVPPLIGPRRPLPPVPSPPSAPGGPAPIAPLPDGGAFPALPRGDAASTLHTTAPSKEAFITPGARSWKQWDGQQAPPAPSTEALFSGPESLTERRPPRPPPRPPPLQGPPDAEILVREPQAMTACVHLECTPKRTLGRGRPFDALPLMADGARIAGRERALLEGCRSRRSKPERCAVRPDSGEVAWSWRDLVDLRERQAEASGPCARCSASITGAAWGCMVFIPCPIPSEAEVWLAEQILPADVPAGRIGLDWLSTARLKGRADVWRRQGVFESPTGFERVVSTGWLRTTTIHTGQLLEALLSPGTPTLPADDCLPPLLLTGLVRVRGVDAASLGPQDLKGLGALAGDERARTVVFTPGEVPAAAAPLIVLFRALHACWVHDVRLVLLQD